MHYDSITKKDMNWNSLEPTIITTTRALSLSGICSRSNKGCFEEEVRKRVLEKERFKGKEVQNLETLIDRGLSDSSPISQIIYHA